MIGVSLRYVFIIRSNLVNVSKPEKVELTKKMEGVVSATPFFVQYYFI